MKSRIPQMPTMPETDDEFKEILHNLEDTIPREKFREIKRMTRQEYIEYQFGLYKQVCGDYEKKLEAKYHSSVASPDYDKIAAEISSIKGIGDVKLKQIMEIIKSNI